MKKLLDFKGWILFALLLVIAGQPSCKKSEAQPLQEYKAYLFLAAPAYDGPLIDELILDSTRETIIPINKKEGWPQSQVGSTPVGIRYIDAGKDFTESINGRTVHLREVFIVSFRVL